MTMRDGRLGVAVIGCGVIGKRRADEAHLHARTRLVATADIDAEAAVSVAAPSGAQSFDEWRDAALRDDVDVVVVATPNASLTKITCAALQAGKHVLVEKPMGRNYAEAKEMLAASEAAGRRLKVGLNHRYHPAVAEAHRRFTAGMIGPFIHARVRYGHGGRPGYEKEWRGSRDLAGGGALTDLGVHAVDLLHWFVGVPDEAFAYLQTAVWPLGDLEDNTFALLRWKNGTVASLHATWTQWKNLFSFELFGRDGSLVVEGLGKSYGVESLTMSIRRPEGGVPEQEKIIFDREDDSWDLEWDDFVSGIVSGSPFLSDAREGVQVMRTLDAIYRSATTGAPVGIGA